MATKKLGTYDHPQLPIQYAVYVSSWAKRISLKVSPPDKVSLTIPHRRYLQQGQRHLMTKSDWLMGELNRYKVDKFSGLANGSTITILDEELTVNYQMASSTEPNIVEKSGEFQVFVPGHSDELVIGEFISQYLRKQYAPLIKSRVAELASELGYKYGKITIRDQSTRWGSCSSKKNLNFNWRLIFAPREVMDYVIIHELAHTVHLNHSQRFWSLVERDCPEYRKCKRWLRDHSNVLYSY